MNVVFTLSAATSGTTASTAFNISGTTSSDVVSELATGITKNQLTTGHTINGVNDAITGGTIASISPSVCVGFTTTWSVIQPTPTPTPTVTPTPTGVPSYSYQIGQSYTQAQAGLACSRLTGSDGEIQDFLTEVFAATDQAANVVQFFTDSNLTSGFDGEGETYTYQKTTGGVTNYTGQVSASGFVTDRTVCPT